MNNKKKVLIITYYWPPAGGSGVQRWVKMAKYFSQQNWEPIVLCPKNPEYPILDESFLKEVKDIPVLQTKIWEPSRFLKKMGAKSAANLSGGFVAEKKSWKNDWAVFLRGNFFIPDARKFWIKPSVNFLKKYLRNHTVDAIISSGPPHSCHLIALPIAQYFKIPWIADFRDPWTNIDFYKDLHLTSWADKKHHELEKKVVQNADCVLVVGSTMKTEMEDIGAKKTIVVANGFDYDYNNLDLELDKKFTITHVGTTGKNRNPRVLWQALQKIIAQNKNFAEDCLVQLVGLTDDLVKKDIQNFQLQNNVVISDLVPHSKAIQIQKNSIINLLIINQTPNAKGILTGKFFEYLSVQRPILAIGPNDGDVAAILKESYAGQIVNFEDVEAMTNILLKWYNDFKNGSLQQNKIDIAPYSRENLSKKVIHELNLLCK
jgi:glycosyltransferase involved in cell wall biosynthesis